MKKIQKGPIFELFDSNLGPNKLTEFVWSQPIGSYFTEKEISKEFHLGARLPKELYKDEVSSNPSLRKEKKDSLVKLYKEAFRKYHKIFKDENFRSTIMTMLEAEKQMIQARCILEIDPKFTILKQKDKDGNLIQYIVARTQFFRPGYKRDEITYYVGKTDDWGVNLDKLSQNAKFRKLAIQGLTEIMMESLA